MTRRTGWLLLTLILAGCRWPPPIVTPPPPPEPPAPTLRAFAALVSATTGRPVVGAVVQIGPHTAVSNADGYALVPALEIPATYPIAVTAASCAPTRLDLAIDAATPDHPIALTCRTAPVLHIAGSDWFNGTERFIPRFQSHLSALRASRTEADWRAFFQYTLDAGFNGVRVFAGALPWADGQTADDARGRLPRYLDLAEEYGLAVEVTAVTEGRRYDWRAHLRAIAAITGPRRFVLLEGANEIGHPTQPDDLTFAAVAEILRDYPGMWAVGAPIGQDEPSPTGAWPAGQGTYSTVHLDRGRPSWDMVRRVREIYAVVEARGPPALDNEPIGCDEVRRPGSRETDPALFAVLGALDAAFRGVGGVHHSQAGLDAVLPGPVQRACAAAYLAAHHAVRSILGPDAGAYRNTGNQGAPVLSADFTQITRAYSFVVGDRAALVQIGEVAGRAALVFAPGWQPIQDVYALQGADGRWLRVTRLGPR